MYLLDSNVFINASRLYYAPTIAPTFWEWLKEQHEQGNLASIAEVHKEIDDGETGHLKTWAAELPSSFWLRSDDATASMAQLTAWVDSPERGYRREAREEFLRIADYYLVAQAHAGKHTVVTFELPAPNSKRRILIPDACIAMNVAYKEPFGVYRKLGLHFS